MLPSRRSAHYSNPLVNHGTLCLCGTLGTPVGCGNPGSGATGWKKRALPTYAHSAIVILNFANNGISSHPSYLCPDAPSPASGLLRAIDPAALVMDPRRNRTCAALPRLTRCPQDPDCPSFRAAKLPTLPWNAFRRSPAYAPGFVVEKETTGGRRRIRTDCLPLCHGRASGSTCRPYRGSVSLRTFRMSPERYMAGTALFPRRCHTHCAAFRWCECTRSHIWGNPGSPSSKIRCGPHARCSSPHHQRRCAVPAPPRSVGISICFCLP